MRLGITGHRPNKLNNEYNGGPLTNKISNELCKAVMCAFPSQPILITGMAQGVDQIFAELAIDMNFRFVAVIPCLEQEKLWPEIAQERYHRILSSPLCHVHQVYNGPYYNGCMQRRNRYIVDNCDKLIAVWDGSLGGTQNCIEYARYVGREIIHINPRELMKY